MASTGEGAANAEPIAVAGAEDTVINDQDSPAPGDSSDAEGPERSAREKLKKTSIAGLQQHVSPTTDTATDATTRARAGTGADLEGSTAAAAAAAAADDDDVDHAAPGAVSSGADGSDPSNENGGIRGRPSKKRSFEDLQKDDPASAAPNGWADLPDPKRGSYHKRMRSRDVDHADSQKDSSKQFDEHGSAVLEESDEEAHLTPGGPGVLVDANSQSDANAQVENSTAKTVSHKAATSTADQDSRTTAGRTDLEGSESTTKSQPQSQPENTTTTSTPSSTLSPSSGFANASSTSPFGTVSSQKEPAKEVPAKESSVKTSNSAFASSGLSAFASSEKSPFGAAAASTKPSSTGFGGSSRGFGSAATASGFGSTSTGFGGGSSVLGSKPASVFGSAASRGFGSASGFGSSVAPKPFGSGLSSFASAAGSKSTFAKSKPFGSKDEDKEDESDQGAEGDEHPAHDDDDGDSKQDSRFHEQEVETGEESERVEFQARARLYHFDKEWKERGTGNIKINTRYEVKSLASKENGKDDDADPEAGGEFVTEVRKARVVMRADGVHRVILNSPVFKGMKVGTNEGKPPVGRTMYLTGLEDGHPRLFQIKIGKEDVLREFYDKIEELKADLE